MLCILILRVKEIIVLIIVCRLTFFFRQKIGLIFQTKMSSKVRNKYANRLAHLKIFTSLEKLMVCYKLILL